jgi:TonB family protein
MAAVVFLAIPLTQLIDAQNSEVLDVRETLTLPPPQALIPPVSPEKEPPQPQEPKPQFQAQLTNLSFNQLDLSLNPKLPNSLEIGMGRRDFSSEVDAVAAIQTVFTFADLNATPRIMNAPSIVYPRELIRRGVREGRVLALIEINTKGRARVLKILAASEPRLVAAAKEVIRKARFSPPTVGGELRTVRGEWPIILRAP